jgi:hypothetical protein
VAALSSSAMLLCSSSIEICNSSTCNRYSIRAGIMQTILGPGNMHMSRLKARRKSTRFYYKMKKPTLKFLFRATVKWMLGRQVRLRGNSCISYSQNVGGRSCETQ